MGFRRYYQPWFGFVHFVPASHKSIDIHKYELQFPFNVFGSLLMTYLCKLLTGLIFLPPIIAALLGPTRTLIIAEG